MLYFLFVLVWLISPLLTCNAYSLRNHHQSQSRRGAGLSRCHDSGLFLAGATNSGSWRPPTSDEELPENTDCVYASSSLRPTTARSSSSSSSTVVRTRTTKLGLLSLDLDDTLFATTPTVREANEAQVSYMNAYLQNNMNNHSDITVEHVWQTTREIRRHVVGSQTYTALRKIAIRRLYAEQLLGVEVDGDNDSNNNNLSWLDTLTEETFQVWLHERHRAAERYLFDSALTSLQQLALLRRQRRADDDDSVAHKDNDDDTGCCVAAITNGRGDPMAMPMLRDCFDFCISGEDADVFPYRKPHAGIYQVALERYRERYPQHHHERRGNRKTMNDTNENGHRKQEQENHYIWIHVGDCLANDVGASADCGAWTIWFAPSSDHDPAPTPASVSESSAASSSNNISSNNNSWSTASKAEWRQRQTLAQQARDKVSIRITHWSELEGAIDELLWRAESALSSRTTTTQQQ